MKLAGILVLVTTGLTLGGVGLARRLPATTARPAAAAAWTPAGTPGLGENLLRNADFTQPSDDWTLQIAGAPARGNVEWLAAGSVLPTDAGKVARLHVQGLGAERWHVQFFEQRLDLREGHTYALSFWARADRARAMHVRGTIDLEDWHGVGLQKVVQLTPEWRRYSATFTARRTIRNHGRLSFLVGDALGTVDLADICLQHDTAASAVRAPHRLVGAWDSVGGEERLRFTFNADGTGSVGPLVKGQSAGSPPRAPVANPFRWYLKGDTGQMMVGKRPYYWTLGTTGRQDRLVLKDARGQVSTLARAANSL